MKHFLLYLALFMVCGTAVTAQTEKDDWMVGGNFNINATDNRTELGFRPSAGYFVARNFALGGNLAFSFSKTGPVKTTQFGLGPFARLYFTRNIFRPFLYGDFTYNLQRTKVPGSSVDKTHFTNFLLGVGGAYFINENVALEAITGYSNTKVKGTDASGGFALRIGFQVYLSKNQVASLRRN